MIRQQLNQVLRSTGLEAYHWKQQKAQVKIRNISRAKRITGLQDSIPSSQAPHAAGAHSSTKAYAYTPSYFMITAQYPHKLPSVGPNCSAHHTCVYVLMKDAARPRNISRHHEKLFHTISTKLKEYLRKVTAKMSLTTGFYVLISG